MYFFTCNKKQIILLSDNYYYKNCYLENFLQKTKRLKSETSPKIFFIAKFKETDAN